MALEKHLEGHTEGEEDEFEDARVQPVDVEEISSTNDCPETQSFYPPPNGPICIPPTIPECDDCDE